jgi:tRNA threonylcarbamoyladenosine modification (KEOPS) complex  Pcc1 subunit
MMTSLLSVSDKTGKLEKVFAPEEKAFLNGRASYALERQGDTVLIRAEAADATAMRAVLSSVCKTIAVYEKAVQVTDDA